MAKLFYPVLLTIIILFSACQQDTVSRHNSAEQDPVENMRTSELAVATFAGGCFWCTEAYFERLKGVKMVVSGYAGGEEQDPTYEQVSNGETGHAEGVQVYYNPEQISFQQLLEVFFATHDPTTLNRQGPDVGKQYRSIIFYNNPDEQKMAENYIVSLTKSERYRNKIVTEVQPLTKFWEAEDYHQDYYVNNPQDPYVVRVARPKVVKFTNEYKGWLKEE